MMKQQTKKNMHWLNKTKIVKGINMNYNNNAFNGRKDVDDKSKSLLSIESQPKFDCCLYVC